MATWTLAARSWPCVCRVRRAAAWPMPPVQTAAAPATRLAAPGLEVFATSEPREPVTAGTKAPDAKTYSKLADKPSRRSRYTRRGLARTAEGNEPVAPQPQRKMRLPDDRVFAIAAARAGRRVALGSNRRMASKST